MESVCDDPEVIAANILVRAASSGLGWQRLPELGARSPATAAPANAFAITFHLGNKQLSFAGLQKLKMQLVM